MAGPKRMQVKFGELAQEIAIAHGLDQEAVDLVLDAYSAAVKRALAENLIVEVLREVRLQVEPYFDPRNSKAAKRLAVNDELRRLRRPADRAPTPAEKEDERATEKLTRILDS
jgi:hypothetical protein